MGSGRFYYNALPPPFFRHSNLGIPGVWAFHIGSVAPLDNVRPATVGGSLSEARSSASREHSFSHAAALERNYSEDDLDYYGENEEETEYPPSEPEEVLRSHGNINASFHSKADSRPVGGEIDPPDSYLDSPLHPTPRNRLFYPETESASLDSQTKEGRRVKEMDALGRRGQVGSSEQPWTRGPAPSERGETMLDPSQGAPPPYLENRSIQPDVDGGALPSERGARPAHGEGEVILPSYARPGHTAPRDHGRHAVGAEDDSSNTGGKRLENWVLRSHL